MPQKLLVGTSKGLIIFIKKNQSWGIQKIHFVGLPVSSIHINPHNNHWWVGISHFHWGQKLHCSKDEGLNWRTYPDLAYPLGATLNTGQPATLKKIWTIQNGGQKYPNRLWIGTEPGGLFLSENNGQSFSLVRSLWNHPSRQNKMQWFGTGRSEPFIHSIVINPKNNDHIYIAVSCAGVFETKDSGQSWQPRNKGLIAAYLPNPEVEIGHDPHRLFICESNPKVIWQQNHCGIFRSTDGALNWKNVSSKTGIPSYGFALAIDNQNPDKAWVIPAVSDDLRIPPNQALVVYRTENGGENWQKLTRGLPQENCFDIVFRHSLDKSENTLAFGTTTGNLYLSENEGDDWICLSNHLARVDCICFA